MSFEVEIDGRVRTVSVGSIDGGRGAPDRFRVLVDGVPEDVAVIETDLGLSLTFADGRVVDAAVTEARRGEWLIQWPRGAATAVVDRRRHGGSVGDGLADGEQRIAAPMPGRVVRVLVGPGDDVSAGQGLVVVEAMKMENELGSPKAGRVKDVLVGEGVSVEAGRVLVIVE